MEIDEGRLECIEAHREGKFHRGEKGGEDQEDQKEPHRDQRDLKKKDQRDQTDPFTEELHKLLDQTIVAADSLLRDKAGRGLPVEKYQYFNILLKY